MATQFSHLSDEELRQECLRHNITVGPIMPSTRKIYEKKLANLLGGGDKGNTSIGSGFESAETSIDQIEPPEEDELEKNSYGNESDTEYQGEESSRILSPEESFHFRKRLTPDRDNFGTSPAANDANSRQLVDRDRYLFIVIFGVIVFLVIFFIFLSENVAKYKSTDEL